MVHREGDSFSQYYKYNTGYNDGGNCNQTCVKSHLCTISNLVLTELGDCLANNDSSIYYHYFRTSETVDEITTTTTTTTTSSSRETVTQPITIGITTNTTSNNEHN